VRNSEQIEE
jgi:PX domain